MIRVERDDPRPVAQRPAALDLDDPTSPASVERAKAIHYFHPAVSHDSDTPPKKPSYAVYGRRDVKAALFNLFHNKCAYCEGEISGNQTGDVEHFRPKGSIKNPDEEPRSPGYYWLAADWNNLFLGCQSCNTARKEPELLADGTWTVARDATGKKDQFPLSDPTRHLESPDDDPDEEEQFRLLLDPCKDNPEDFLSYDADGMILPKDDDHTSFTYEKALKSIEVFDLKRSGLNGLRRAHHKLLSKAWRNVRDVKQLFIDTYEADPATRDMLTTMVDGGWRENLERNSEDLIASINSDQVFAGFSRHLFADLVVEAGEIRQRFEEIYGKEDA